MWKRKNIKISVKTFILFITFSVTMPLTGLFALENPGTDLDAAGIDMKQGQELDLSLSFTDSSGKQRSLKSAFLEGKPLILIPVYYECPRLCGLLLSAAVKLFNDMNLRLGDDYTVAAVSFDTSEGPEEAKKAESTFLNRLDSRLNSNAWSFFVGSKDSVSRLMQQIGFRYIPDKGEFAHAATLVVVTPDGKIAQYFTGISFSSPDVRLALVEAARGGIGSVVDQVLLFCFRFDPTKGKYTWAAWNFVRFGSILCVALFVLVVARVVRRN
jgi:protein SCO1